MDARFTQMPAALRANARWQRLGSAGIPAMLVHPRWDSGMPVPVVLWLHGRTAHKELDPGRYLRWMRAGLGVCAIDLPGHGERFDPALQNAAATPGIVRQAIEEIDQIVEALASTKIFDLSSLGIGGMSAGGMTVLARLCKQHAFRCASVEAATGAWRLHWPDATGSPHASVDWAADFIRTFDPIEHLESWREIPVQFIHSMADQLVSFESQKTFVEALRQRYRDQALIELIAYERTGAPQEHIGFGNMSADAKDRQRTFFERWLLG